MAQEKPVVLADAPPGTVRGVHDYGGLAAGPVDRHEHAATLYEKRVDAMKVLVQQVPPGKMTSDVSRRTQEALDQQSYDTLAYYDRWLVALKTDLIELGFVTEDEVARRIAEIRARD